MLSAPLAAAALCASFIVAVHGLPGRWPKQLMALTTHKFDTADYRTGTCLLITEGPESFTRDCFAESKDGQKRVLIVGDSRRGAFSGFAQPR